MTPDLWQKILFIFILLLYNTMLNRLYIFTFPSSFYGSIRGVRLQAEMELFTEVGGININIILRSKAKHGEFANHI